MEFSDKTVLITGGASGIGALLGECCINEGANVGYAASKSALMNGVVKSVALCGAQYNIRACCVAPGPVLTRPSMSYMSTLVGRAAKPQEIVYMIIYLASSKGSFVNGTTILIDGGRFAMFQKK